MKKTPQNESLPLVVVEFSVEFNESAGLKGCIVGSIFPPSSDWVLGLILIKYKLVAISVATSMIIENPAPIINCFFCKLP